ncbi:MAG: hypothetical protein LBB80_00920 [Treponema sp.]|nr:hypothetical protein [Treponema sp.]
MSQKTDWLPSDRTGPLAMAKDWHSVGGANALCTVFLRHIFAVAGIAS